MEEMGYFNSAVKSNPDVVFLMVNSTSNDTMQAALSAVSGYANLPLYFDTTGNAVNTYGIRSFPQTLFINSNGTLMKQQVGAVTASTLQGFINQLS